MKSRTLEGGFSLLEILVATALLLVISGVVFAVVGPGSGTARAQSEVADLQQRLRVAVEAIRHDLAMAGAGTYLASGVGPLTRLFAPVLPHTTGPLLPGSPAVPQDSAITVLYVPPTASQTRLRSELRAGVPGVLVEPGAGCPTGPSRAVCGFEAGMRVAVFDAHGAHDVFTVTGTDGGVVQLEGRDGAFASTYAPGASMTEIVAVSYHLQAAERRLYRYDGHRTNLPLIDDVVGLRFDYFGDPLPPAIVSAGTEADRSATYGPAPPPGDVDRAGDDWGAGENCTFAFAGGQHVSRLSDWQGDDPSSALVPIPLERFGDGPWCPGATTAVGAPLGNRYDADLLRIRRVRVTVRVQVGSGSLRGSNPPGLVWFVHPGTSRAGERFIRDQEIRFDVAPRNMNLGR